MDWTSAPVKSAEMISYWDEIGKGNLKLTKEDIRHVCGCMPCQQAFLEALQSYRLKITPELMAALTNDNFKQEVVRALCLRAVAATVAN